MPICSFIYSFPECINIGVATFGIVVPETAGITRNAEATLRLFGREA